MWRLRRGVGDWYIGEVILTHGVDCIPICTISVSPFSCVPSVEAQLTNTDGERAKTKTSEDVADQVRLASTNQRSALAVVLVVVR